MDSRVGMGAEGMANREDIIMGVMRRVMDRRDSIWIIGGGEAASWKLCWRV
jgi:hypothetical protein